MKSSTKSPQEAQARLEEMCVTAEHCSGEMYDKLRRWGISGNEAEKIVESLKKGRFIDDERFARAYVRDKVMLSRWGRRKVAQGLYAKKVDRDIIREALNGIDEDAYIDNLRHVIGLKIKSAPSLLESFEGRTKIFRFGVSRGYELQLVTEVLREVINGLTP